MSINYVRNACDYLRVFIPYMKDWYDEDEVLDAIGKVRRCNGYKVKFELGSSRYVLVGEDFVIKWDYNDDLVSEIGGCEEEYKVFKKWFSTKWRYLLAPVFKVRRNGRYFYIMPRINGVGWNEHQWKDIDEFTSAEEFQWLYENIGDLHHFNWGLVNGHVVMIDYACLPGREYV